MQIIVLSAIPNVLLVQRQHYSVTRTIPDPSKNLFLVRFIRRTAIHQIFLGHNTLSVFAP